MALGSLRSRIEKRKDGTLTGRPDRITFGELKDGGRKHYVREDNRSWTRASLFGSDSKAMNITKARVSDYQDARLESGAARNSVRCEVGVLSAAFGVAVDQAMLAAATGCKPRGEMPACCSDRARARAPGAISDARQLATFGAPECQRARLCGCADGRLVICLTGTTSSTRRTFHERSRSDLTAPRATTAKERQTNP